MLIPTRSLRAAQQKWTSTLRLPKSSFPARPTNLTTYLRRCTDEFYAWQSNRQVQEGAIASNDQKVPTDFVLHDGPPYANGSLHIGHALNKITKDIICRYQVSQGKRVSYIPGWDCHGLPIEIKALQALEQKRIRKALSSSSEQSGESGKQENAAGVSAEPDYERLGPIKVRKAARELALKTVEEQKKGFREWAVMGEWENAYRTMDKDFEMRQLDVFKSMVEKGLIYRQTKPVYWSPSSGTALAEAELEYDENHLSNSAFIKYPLATSNFQEFLRRTIQESLPKDAHGKRICALIWTTTPWTLPANHAIAVRSDIRYVLTYDENDPSGNCDFIIVAKSRLEHIETQIGRSLCIVKDNILGSELAGRVDYFGPFSAKPENPDMHSIIHADFVSEDSGTGLVHLAPGHGMDDYNVCGQPPAPLSPVDDKGRYTRAAFPIKAEYLEGLPVLTYGGPAVLKFLDDPSVCGLDSNRPYHLGGLVLATHEYRHKYPIDWRSKQPVIIRATEQWFANVDDIKSDAIGALENVTFIPEGGKSRLSSFVQGRSQWCVSRQRAWGVPIPALYRIDNGKLEAVMTEDTIAHIMNIIDKRGIDAWWTDPEDDTAWVPQGLEGTYVRGKDTMDVWFDSGTSWRLLSERKDRPVADVYLEGTDQHRGWFQSSLLTHISSQYIRLKLAHKEDSMTQVSRDSGAIPLRAPFKTLITHGFTLDQNGRKMSKSLGNTILPSEIINGTLLPPLKPKKQKNSSANPSAKPTYDSLGPDTLRLWAASSDYTKDVVIGLPVLQSITSNLHKYRITFKWILGVLSDFRPDRKLLESSNAPTVSPKTLADALALRALASTSTAVHQHFSAFEFFRGISVLNKFIAQDMSAFYFETLKDRVYAGEVADRLAAQEVLFVIFNSLLEMLSPICPVLVEEVWEFWLKDHADIILAHPAKRVTLPFDFSATEESIKGKANGMFDQLGDLNEISEVLQSLQTRIKAAQESAREAKEIGSGLESEVWISVADTIPTGSPLRRVIQPELVDELAALWVVSRVTIYSEQEVQRRLGENTTKIWQANTHENASEGVTVYVVKARRSKCQRCWRFVVEKEEEEKGICGRCENASQGG